MARIYFETLGCDKNLVDSEKMLGLLLTEGHSFTDEAEKADILIVNTCSFIGDAKKESIDAILRLADFKKLPHKPHLIAAGCLAQRYQDEILKELPELDAVIGTSSYPHIAEAVALLLKEPAKTEPGLRFFDDINALPLLKERILTGGGHTAYLKIAEGCDKFCTYCAIPYVRGKYRSVPMEDILDEAERLVREGVRELILVAQETTLYGTDLYGEKMLPQLLLKLEALPDLEWIRLLYGYPEELTDEMIDTIARSSKICHYIDLPVQHASDSVLSRMGRRTCRAEFENKIKQLRRKIPDIILRTTLLCGFPGETEEDHAANLDFIKKMRFDRLGVFAYSREEGTAAGRMKGQIPQRTKEKRRKELMLAQQKVAWDNNKRRIGSLMRVMIEGRLADEEIYVARSYGDAPDVDGYVFLNSQAELESGRFVTVRITAAREYDLIGELV